MDIIKKSDLILNVAERWNSDYKNSNYYDKIAIGNRLRTEKPQTEAEVKNIIGNGTWTQNTCDECGKDFEVIINLGNSSDRDIPSFNICKKCLKEALTLIKNNL